MQILQLLIKYLEFPPYDVVLNIIITKEIDNYKSRVNLSFRGFNFHHSLQLILSKKNILTWLRSFHFGMTIYHDGCVQPKSKHCSLFGSKRNIV